MGCTRTAPAPATGSREQMVHVCWVDSPDRALCGMTSGGEATDGAIECVVCAALIEQAIRNGDAEPEPRR